MKTRERRTPWRTEEASGLDEIARRHGLSGLYPVEISKAVANADAIGRWESQRERVSAGKVYAPRKTAFDPRIAFPWAGGAVSAVYALASAVTGGREPETKYEQAVRGRMARFASPDGGNYERFRQRLEGAAKDLEGLGIGRWEISIDGPGVLDRSVALAAGAGWLGKSTMVISRITGTWMLLGTLITEAPPHPDLVRAPIASRCGGCVACVQACPTGALREAYRCDASRCLSLSTQSPVEIPHDRRFAIGTTIYGCDICQSVCPVNHRLETSMGPTAGLDLTEIAAATASELDTRFARLYFPRRDFSLLRRNAIFGLVNALRAGDGRGGCIEGVRGPACRLLRRIAEDEKGEVPEHARWALEVLGFREY